MSQSVCAFFSGIAGAAWILSALFFSLLVFCSSVNADQRVLVIDYPDYWPFFSRQKNGEMAGFFYEVVDEALGRLNIETEWRVFPWSRCQAHVKNGESEAMVTVPTPERLKYAATHPDPFYMKALNVFTYTDHPSMNFIRSMKTFDDIKRGGLTVITYAGNGWNDRNIRARGIKVYETPVINTVWRMLAFRRGDIVIEWPMAAWAEIRRAGVSLDEVVQTDVAFAPMPFHLMIGKGSPDVEILGEFNRVVLEMKESGRIGEIVDRYMHPD